jgi:hypothetical protein
MPRFGSQFGSTLDTASQTEVYRNAEYRQRCLRHRVVRGRHIISIEYPLLERSRTEVYAATTVGEARDMWVGLRTWLDREGYERMTR